MKLALLSNVNLDMLAKQLGREHDVYEVEGYAQWVQYALSPNEALLDFDPKMVFLIIDGNELVAHCSSADEGSAEIAQALDLVAAMADAYPRCTLAVSNIDVRRAPIMAAVEEGSSARWEHEWSSGLHALAAEKANVIPFDLQGVLRDLGRDAAYSGKMWYTGSIPYSLKGLGEIESAIKELIGQVERTRKKVLVVDLDNTLWGGVVGEDGPEGIVLGESGVGAAYRDAQKRMREMAATGVLLAIASKNNPEDADAAFEENPHMVLSKDDFVSVKANWSPKAENVAAMASELNLGVDSFVFLDDNPVEREQMAAMLPEVVVADFPKDVSRLPETIEALYRDYFWVARRTAEDAAKTQQYKQEAKRAAVRDAAGSMEDYLRSLEMDVCVCEARDEHMTRVVQLLSKTNQFNTNTVRMDDREMARWREAEGHRVFVAAVSDRYGDSGLVALMLVERSGDEAVIANLLMSCRVMGRQVENAFVGAVCERLADAGVSTLRASYVPTAKNKPVEELFERLGFELAQAGPDGKSYRLALPAEIGSVIEARWEE